MSFRFITNLRSQTIRSFAQVSYQPQGWLLSTHRATKSSLQQAINLRAAGYDLFADNGTKQLIDRAIRHFEPDLVGLTREIVSLRRNLPDSRRMPRPSEVPSQLRSSASAMAHRVCDYIDTELQQVSVTELTQLQIEMQGNHIIAKEDYAVACLMALGLEREITGWPVSYFNRRNKKTIDFWHQTTEQAANPDIKIYATLSAMDYATARAAARLAARDGIHHIAIGFAGINRDRSFTESYALPYRTNLPGSAPRQYVRTTEILLGIRDGFTEENVVLQSFHGLGLGATAEFPLLSYIMANVANLSVDATSPIHDAVNDLVYYDENNSGDRISVVEAATDVVNGNGWRFKSPVMSQCRETLRYDPESAILWWDSISRRPIIKQDLEPENTLGLALSVFANGAGSSTTSQRLFRVAHNHWVCDHLAAQVPDSGGINAWSIAEIESLIASRPRTTRWGLMAAKHILEASL